MDEVLSILIIDDNPDERASYIRFLTKVPEISFCCHETSDGIRGLEAIANISPDCVLLDYSLPGSNGLEVFDRIRSTYPQLPVLMLTGQENPAIAVQAMRGGIDDYLPKADLTPETLVHAIRVAMERRQTELQRQQLIEKLVESNTELERFAYVASHDIQEPVRMMIRISKMIAADYGEKLDQNGRDCLRLVIDSASRIHHMIDDLLDYARLNGDAPNTMLVDTEHELANVLVNLSDLIHETKAHVTYDIMPKFQGNAAQFTRLMQNLIVNAIKYQPPGRTPVIHIGVKDGESGLLFSVKDNGLGIDEAYVQKIFEPFRRLHTWEKIKGTGIGLAVCKKIVENHGGKIWVSSVPKQGSTFFITFPKQSVKQQAA